MGNNTTVLSAEAKAVIDVFLRNNVLDPMSLYNLVGTLYSRREDARKDIVLSISVDMLMSSPLGMSEADLTILDAEYYSVLKYCHEVLAEEGRFQRENNILHLPREVCELVSRLVDSREEDSVFLPLAGYAEMAFYMNAKTISGFEFNDSAWAFDNIFLDAYGIEGGIKTRDNGSDDLDILLSEQLTDSRYKHIISFPPRISVKVDRQIAQYMQHILENNVEEEGNMCLVLPSGDLSSMQWVKFRRFLMENKTKFEVLTISLPAVFMPVTGVKYSLMLIQKGENPDGTFFFMDADRQVFYTVSKENRKQPQLKVESIMESLKIRDERYVREIDVEDNPFFGKNNLCSFAPSRYFVYDELPDLEYGFEYHTLGELVKNLNIPGMADSDLQYGRRAGRYVRFTSLYDNYMACEIDYNAITSAPIPFSAYCAYANGGYAAFVNGRIKVGQISGMYSDSGRFDDCDPYSDSTIIYVDNNVAHFAPKANGTAQLDYILRELMSDYVLEQAKKLAYGTVKQEMRHNDFFKLKIAVPSIERQDDILKQDRIAAVEKAGVKVDELNEKFRKDSHMMKHALGQTVFNLSNWMQILNQARKQGNGILDENAQIGNRVKVSIGDVFDNIEMTIKVLSRQVSSFDVGYGMKMSRFSLADFLDNYIATHPRPNVRYDFASSQYRSQEDVPAVDLDDSDPNDMKIIEHPGEFFVRKGDAYDYVDFPEEALTIIVDNIVSNAVSHGFKELGKEYTIHFEFISEGANYILSISNNGAPLALEGAEDVFVMGQTTGGGDHAGIGGYQIRSLMEDFGGKAEIVSTPNEEYTVTYKLTFTKTNLIDLKL